jgi:hypothetical protein
MLPPLRLHDVSRERFLEIVTAHAKKARRI